MKVVFALVTGVFVALLFRSILLWLARQWVTHDYYAHGPLILMVSAFLIWRRWGRPEPTAQASYAGGLLLVAGAGGHTWAAAHGAMYLSAVCPIFVLAALFHLLRGRAGLGREAFRRAFLAAAYRCLLWSASAYRSRLSRLDRRDNWPC